MSVQKIAIHPRKITLIDSLTFRYVFIGDQSGQITVCRLDSTGVTFVNTMKGQSGSVQCLTWDGDIGWLFSGKSKY